MEESSKAHRASRDRSEALFSEAQPQEAQAFRRRLEAKIKTQGTETMTITPLIAEVMLERNQDNRNLNRTAAQRMADAIQRGDWQLTGQPIIFCRDGRLNDGQHRLHAVVLAGMAIRSDVRFGVERAAFLATDIGHKRTAADAFTIRQEKNSTTLAGAIRLAWNFSTGATHFSGSLTPAEAVEFLERNPDLRGATERGRSWNKSFRQVGGAVFAFTYWHCARIDRALADTMFEQLATGVGFQRNTHPVCRLRNWLTNQSAGHGKIEAVTQITVIFKTWNALRDGHTSRMLQLGNNQQFPIPR